MLIDEGCMIVSNVENGHVALSEISDIPDNMRNGYIPTIVLGLSEKNKTVFTYGCNGSVGGVTFNELDENPDYNVGDIIKETDHQNPYFRIIFTNATSLKIMMRNLSNLYENFSEDERKKAEEASNKYDEYMKNNK